MVKVAIAGGTGGVGLHVAKAILDTKKHDVVILTRKASNPELERLGAVVRVVSYDDITSLTTALHGVHTVISTIGGFSEETLVAPQLVLLDAAVKAGVKRFAPSEFGARSQPDGPTGLHKLKWLVAQAVRKSGLEYTVFEIGMFMNDLAVGTEGLASLRPFNFPFDVANCKARLPGDGSAELVLTRVEDTGKFVAASLELEVWPELSQMRGDRKPLNEILRLAEAVRGEI